MSSYKQKYAAWKRAHDGAQMLRAMPPPEQDWFVEPSLPYYEYIREASATGPFAWREVLYQVCQKHRITMQELVGVHRAVPLCAARHEAAFRLIVELGLSYPAAGRRLSRDHSTIIQSVKRFVNQDPVAASKYSEFCSRLEGQAERLKAEIIRLHYVEGMSVSRLAKRFGMDRTKLTRWLVEGKPAAMKAAA